MIVSPSEESPGLFFGDFSEASLAPFFNASLECFLGVSFAASLPFFLGVTDFWGDFTFLGDSSLVLLEDATMAKYFLGDFLGESSFFLLKNSFERGRLTRPSTSLAVHGLATSPRFPATLLGSPMVHAVVLVAMAAGIVLLGLWLLGLVLRAGDAATLHEVATDANRSQRLGRRAASRAARAAVPRAERPIPMRRLQKVTTDWWKRLSTQEIAKKEEAGEATPQMKSKFSHGFWQMPMRQLSGLSLASAGSVDMAEIENGA